MSYIFLFFPRLFFPNLCRNYAKVIKDSVEERGHISFWQDKVFRPSLDKVE